MMPTRGCEASHNASVTGIDGHASYVVVTTLNVMARILHAPVHIKSSESHRLIELLEVHRLVEAGTETSRAWP